MDDDPDELHRAAVEGDDAGDTGETVSDAGDAGDAVGDAAGAAPAEPAPDGPRDATDAHGDTAAEPSSAAAEEAPTGRLTKAERLEAKAARLRDAEERRTQERAAARVAAEERAAAWPPPGYGQPATRGPGWMIAASVLGAVSVGLLTVLIIGFISWQHQRDVNSDRADVQTLARQYAIDFGTYDYQHLDADFKKVESHLTASFKKSYATSSAGLAPTVVQYKGKAVATVQGVGVTTVSSSKATVVILLDQTVTTTQSSTPRIDRNRLVMKLVHQHGTWLIESLNSP
jgi:Mce-associated membrane protein